MQRYDLYPTLVVMHRNSKKGGTFLARVLKVNPKNILVQYESGARWNTSPSLLDPAPEGAVFNIDETEGLELGDPVRFIDNNPHAGDAIYVVLSHDGLLYKVAKLRGSGNRYFNKVPASSLVLVPVGEVTV